MRGSFEGGVSIEISMLAFWGTCFLQLKIMARRKLRIED